jgi:predicted enzyme related to lactoylglutathione lyase
MPRPLCPGIARPAALAVAAYACVAALPAHAAPVSLPPVMTPPNHEQHIGKPIFADLVTPDLAAAEKFYGGLFGWRFQAVPGTASPHAEAMLDGQNVAGLVEKPLPAAAQRQSAWLSFLAVANVDDAVKLAEAQGATLLMPAHDAPGRGREALLADPQGAVFGILDSSSGTPPDVLPDTGNFIWESLHAADPLREAAFYTKLFGYQVAGGPPDGDGTHLLLASESFARASINVIPAHYTGHGQWVSYVRVDDAAKAAAKAVSLGGRILVQPWTDRDGGMIAIIADPSGAAIGLFDWPEDGNAPETKKDATP